MEGNQIPKHCTRYKNVIAVRVQNKNGRSRTQHQYRLQTNDPKPEIDFFLLAVLVVEFLFTVKVDVLECFCEAEIKGDDGDGHEQVKRERNPGSEIECEQLGLDPHIVGSVGSVSASAEEATNDDIHL
jgi:hypothetical protein